VPAPARASGDPADGVVDAVEVSRALSRLPATHRGVLVQVFLRDQTLVATARALGGIPEGTAKSRLRNGLAHLRQCLRESGPRLS